MPNSVIIKHSNVVLKMSKSNDTFLTEAKGISSAVGNLTNFPTFPTSSITLIQFNAHITTLDHAQSGLKLKPPTSTVASRDAAKTVVEADLEYIRLGIQVLVNGNAANAATIAGNADMQLKITKSAGSRSDAAKNNTLPGSILLTGAGKGAHQWQTSDDSIVWIDQSPTTSGKKQIDGLTSGTLMYVRNRTVLPKGQYGAWSNPIKVRVN